MDGSVTYYLGSIVCEKFFFFKRTFNFKDTEVEKVSCRRNGLKKQVTQAKEGAWSLKRRERQGKGQVGGERCWRAPERAPCGSFGALSCTC